MSEAVLDRDFVVLNRRVHDLVRRVDEFERELRAWDAGLLSRTRDDLDDAVVERRRLWAEVVEKKEVGN